jgi:hypothetical protein
MRNRRWRVACGTLVLSALARSAAAQAWVPPAGTGSIDLFAQRIDNTGHRLSNGETFPVGKSLDASIYVGVEYGVTDRFAVSGGIPLVFAKFTSREPSPLPLLPVDACHCWHAAWQDVSLTARYRFGADRYAVTPTLAIGVPSHAYPYQGEAVPGRRVKELRIGLAAARRLDALSSRLAVQGEYSYAIVQKVAGIGMNRSDLTADVAFRVAERLSVRGFTTVQRTHGGLRGGVDPPPPLGYPSGEVVTAELYAQHDRLLRDNNVRAGFGAAYSFARFDVAGSFVSYVSGTNTHAGHAVTLGISVPFELRRP